jgi:hypothetical protein
MRFVGTSHMCNNRLAVAWIPALVCCCTCGKFPHHSPFPPSPGSGTQGVFFCKEFRVSLTGGKETDDWKFRCLHLHHYKQEQRNFYRLLKQKWRKRKYKYSLKQIMRPIGLWEVEAPKFSRQSTLWWKWGCQLYVPSALYPEVYSR